MFGDGSGLNGWAWHELGRQSERTHQAQMRAVDAFAARLRGEVPIDVDALVAENQALWQRNQELTERVQAYDAAYRSLEARYRMLEADEARLRAWAEDAQAKLLLHDAKRDPTKRDKERLKRDTRNSK